MSDPVKLSGIPVEQCEFTLQSKSTEMKKCGETIVAEQKKREKKGEQCSTYMNVFSDNKGTKTVLTLVCNGEAGKASQGNKPNHHFEPVFTKEEVE